MNIEVNESELKRAGFCALTSLVCEILAFVFFFCADWRVGVGYCFVWLAEMNFKVTAKAMRLGITKAVELSKKKDDK